MDSARHKMLFVTEAAYGVLNTNPEFDTLRHTGTTLVLNKAVMISDELRSDRQISTVRHGARSTAGDVTAELSYGSFDKLLEAALCGTWADKFAPYTATTISAAAADNSINDSGNAFPAYEPGDVVAITGFTGTVGNNATWAKVVSRTAGKVVLQTATPLVNDAAGESVTITTLSDILKAGTTRRSFSIIRHFEDMDDADGSRHVFLGQEINTFGMQFAAGDDARASLTFGFIGQDNDVLTAAPSGEVVNAATTTEMMDCLSGAVEEGGTEIAVITEFNFTLENGVQLKPVVGSPLTLHPGIGRSNANGTATAYFEDSALYLKFKNETSTSLRFRLLDLVGNEYAVKFPNVKYTGAQTDVSGQASITTPLPFQAIYNAASATQVSITRSPAVA